MKKTALIVVVVALLGVGAYLGATALASGDSSSTAAGTSPTSSTDPNQPDRTAEVKGVVVSMDGTDVVIDRYIQDPSEELTDEEKAAKKAARAQLSQEERQALKAAENAVLETERVTVTVPVGTPIVQMVLNGDESVAEPAALAGIRSGMEVTVWTDGGTDGATAQYVKIATTK